MSGTWAAIRIVLAGGEDRGGVDFGWSSLMLLRPPFRLLPTLQFFLPIKTIQFYRASTPTPTARTLHILPTATKPAIHILPTQPPPIILPTKPPVIIQPTQPPPIIRPTATPPHFEAEVTPGALGVGTCVLRKAIEGKRLRNWIGREARVWQQGGGGRDAR